MKTTAVFTLAAVASFLGFAQPSDAALLYTVQNVGSDMVLSSSGSLNIADAVTAFENPGSPCSDAPGSLNASSICVGQPDASGYSRYQTGSPFGFVPLDDIGGLSPFFFPPDELTGMFSEVHFDTSTFFVSNNYVSGTPLIGTARWHNREWAGFGIVPNQSGFVRTLIGAEGEVVDTISFLVNETAVVPLPATSLLLFTGIGALMVLRRRRSANSPNAI